MSVLNFRWQLLHFNLIFIVLMFQCFNYAQGLSNNTRTTNTTTNTKPPKSKLDRLCDEFKYEGFKAVTLAKKDKTWFASIVCDAENRFYSTPLPQFTESTNKYALAHCDASTDYKWVQDFRDTKAELNCQEGSPTKYLGQATHMISEDCVPINSVPLRYGLCSVKCAPGYSFASVNYATEKLKNMFVQDKGRQSPLPGKAAQARCSNGCTRPGSDKNTLRDAFGQDMKCSHVGCVIPSTALCNDLISSCDSSCNEELGYFPMEQSSDEDVNQPCSYGEFTTEPLLQCDQGCRKLDKYAFEGYVLNFVDEIANDQYTSGTFSCAKGFIRTNRGEFGSVTLLRCRLGEYGQDNVRFQCKKACTFPDTCDHTKGEYCIGRNDVGDQFCSKTAIDNFTGEKVRSNKKVEED